MVVSLGKRSRSTLNTDTTTSKRLRRSRSSNALSACSSRCSSPTPSVQSFCGQDNSIANKENIPPEFQENDTDQGAQRSRRHLSRSTSSTSLSMDASSSTPSIAIESSKQTSLLTPDSSMSEEAPTDKRQTQLLAPQTSFVKLTPPQTPASRRFRNANPVAPVAAEAAAQSLNTPAKALSGLAISSPRTPQTPHGRARASLRCSTGRRVRNTVTRVTVTGRTQERAKIMDFLQPLLDTPDTSSPSSMYVSGTPGVGKTALVLSVLHSIESSHPNIKSAYVNCMGIKAGDIETVWERILEVVDDVISTPSKRRNRADCHKTSLERVLANDDMKCVIVLDELDTLLSHTLNGKTSRKQTLTQLFKLPTSYPDKVKMIGISNDLALASVLDQDLLSTVTTLNFSPYRAEEIESIIKARVCEDDSLTKVIDPKALSLMSKKVAAKTGDVRMALDILRKSIDLAAKPTKNTSDHGVTSTASPSTVSINHILKATALSNVGSGTAIVRAVRGLELQGCLVLCAVAVAARRIAARLGVTHGVPSGSSTPTTPSKRGTNDPTSLTPSALYKLYTQMLDTYDPVSSNEFRDILGILETSSLLVRSIPSSLSPSKSKSRSFGGKNGSMISAAEGTIQFGNAVREDEVLKGLIEPAPGAEESVKMKEVKRIWKKELRRIEDEMQAMQWKDKHTRADEGFVNEF